MEVQSGWWCAEVVLCCAMGIFVVKTFYCLHRA